MPVPRPPRPPARCPGMSCADLPGGPAARWVRSAGAMAGQGTCVGKCSPRSKHWSARQSWRGGELWARSRVPLQSRAQGGTSEGSALHPSLPLFYRLGWDPPRQGGYGLRVDRGDCEQHQNQQFLSEGWEERERDQPLPPKARQTRGLKCDGGGAGGSSSLRLFPREAPTFGLKLLPCGRETPGRVSRQQPQSWWRTPWGWVVGSCGPYWQAMALVCCGARWRTPWGWVLATEYSALGLSEAHSVPFGLVSQGQQCPLFDLKDRLEAKLPSYISELCSLSSSSLMLKGSLRKESHS